MSPSFTQVSGMSAVTRQPETQEERLTAAQALLACPTHSIHFEDPGPGELQAARDSFPLPIATDGSCPGVFHLGYHDERTYGAAPYLIVRPEGNVMVDVPRWQPQLADKLEALGGVRYIFMTHEDHVNAHERWAARLGAQRIIHRKSVRTRQGTDQAERILDGEGPWRMDDGHEDVQLLFTPGHTAGSVSLWYGPGRALFTGDHLAYSARLGRLTIFRAYNWHSVPLQLDSVRSLLPLSVLHLLPGHGRRYRFSSDQEWCSMMQQLLEAEEAERW